MIKVWYEPFNSNEVQGHISVPDVAHIDFSVNDSQVVLEIPEYLISQHNYLELTPELTSAKSFTDKMIEESQILLRCITDDIKEIMMTQFKLLRTAYNNDFHNSYNNLQKTYEDVLAREIEDAYRNYESYRTRG